MDPLSISFGIKTNRKKEWKLAAVIASILAQGIEAAQREILVTGDTDFSVIDGEMAKQIRLLPDLDAAANGKLAKMMNTLAGAAIHPWICLCDDDIIFTDGWYEKVCRFIAAHPEVDVCTFPIRNTDGSRFWDWAVHVDGQSVLIDPNVADQRLYVTGGMVLMRREVWQKVQWNADLGFYQGEDVDWSRRMIAADFTVALCSAAFVMHNDWRYLQVGPGVKCLKDIGDAIAAADRPTANHVYRQFLEESGKSLDQMVAALQELRWKQLPDMAAGGDAMKLSQAIEMLGRVESALANLGGVTRKLGDYAG
jgi:hypothetical protein